MINLIRPWQVLGRLAAAMILASAMSGTLLAQDVSEAHTEAARKAMVATGATERLDNILPGVAARVKTTLIQNRPDIEAEISATVDEVAITLAGRRGSLEEEVAKIYTQMFSEEELETITVFFSSETGNKFLSQTPFLFRSIDQASAVWSRGIARDLTKEVGDKMREKGLQ